MTQANPFAQHAPAPEQAPNNPFAQQQAAPAAVAAPAGPNPFAAGVPTQAAAAPVAPAAPNPFAQQAAAPAPTANFASNPYAQAPAPAAPAAGAPMLDPNALSAAPPPVISDGKGPKLPDMYSRLCLFFPQQLETVPRNPRYITEAQRVAGNVTQQRLTATVVILDSGPGTPPGGTIAWGGAPHQIGGAPHTNNDPLPYVRAGMWINQSRLISQLQPFLPNGSAPGGMVVGRLAKAGPENNDPWYLIAATEPEIALAQTYLRLVGAGQYRHPLAP